MPNKLTVTTTPSVKLTKNGQTYFIGNPSDISVRRNPSYYDDGVSAYVYHDCDRVLVKDVTLVAGVSIIDLTMAPSFKAKKLFTSVDLTGFHVQSLRYEAPKTNASPVTIELEYEGEPIQKLCVNSAYFGGATKLTIDPGCVVNLIGHDFTPGSNYAAIYDPPIVYSGAKKIVVTSPQSNAKLSVLGIFRHPSFYRVFHPELWTE